MIYINVTKVIIDTLVKDAELIYAVNDEIISTLANLSDFKELPPFAIIEAYAETYVKHLREVLRTVNVPNTNTPLMDDGNVQITVVIDVLPFLLPEVVERLAQNLSVDVSIIHEFSGCKALVKVADGGI